MLRLLLDIHIDPAVVPAVNALNPDCSIESLRDWQDGTYRDAPDHQVLEAAQSEEVTLVTYDQRTIAPLLRDWAARDRTHAGVLFVDDRTVRPDDIGGLAAALARFWDAYHVLSWTNVVMYLQR